jgi:hypothetical protein
LPDRTVVATFPNLDQARHAIEELGSQAIRGDEISFLGEEAATQPGPDGMTVDARVSRRVPERVVAGAVIGGALGAVLSVPAALMAAGPTSLDLNLGTLPAAFFLTTFCLSVVGALAGYVSSLRAREAGLLSVHPASNRLAIVGVHTDEREELRKATEVLRQQRPLELYYVDAQGQRVPAR